MPLAGLEPARCCQQQILSLPRLPFRHRGTREKGKWRRDNSQERRAVNAGLRDRFAGFATAGSDGAIQAYLILIGVDARYRGRGVGTKLVEEVHRRTGARRMDLLSTEGADKFYETFPYARKLPGYRIYPGAPRPSADV